MSSVTFQQSGPPSRRRSSSVSPSANQPPKRRGTFDFFSARAPKEDVLESESSTPGQRKYSFLASLDLFSFKATPKGDGCEQMHTPNKSSDYNSQQQCNGNGAGEGAADVDDEPPAANELSGVEEKSQSRRSSRFSSIGEKIKSFFPVTRRKDSGMDGSFSSLALFDRYSNSICPQLPSFQSDPHSMGELFINTAAMEPLAQHGCLRFAASSTDALQSFDGPSDYWRTETYQNRRCTDIRKDDSIEQPGRRSLDYFPTRPTPETNAEAGVIDDPHRWHTLRSYSPPVTMPEEDPPQPQQPFRLRLGSFGILGRRRKKDRGKQAVPRPLAVLSAAPSQISAMCTPDPFGPTPNLNLSVSISEIGVLPVSEASSVDNSRDIPQPVYISKSLSSSLVPLVGLPIDNENGLMPSQENIRSRSPSVFGRCPSSSTASRISGPVIELSTQEIELPSMLFDPPSPPTPPKDYPLPILPTAKPLPPLPLSQPTASGGFHARLASRLAGERSAANSPCTSSHTNISRQTDKTNDTQRTVPDDMACSEDLQLRRSSSLADILEIFDVDGQGHFNFDIGREAGEDLEVVESVDAERGRSRVRRGE